jgi:hypothetical protein
MMFCGVSTLASSLMINSFLRSEMRLDYLVAFYMGTFFMVISLICCLILKYKPFSYRKHIGGYGSMLSSSEEIYSSINI